MYFTGSLLKNKAMIKKIKVYIAILFAILSFNTFSQPLPPGYPNGHGQTNNQPGGGAPIDGGFGILLVLSVFYGTKKVYSLKVKSETK